MSTIEATRGRNPDRIEVRSAAVEIDHPEPDDENGQVDLAGLEPMTPKLAASEEPLGRDLDILAAMEREEDEADAAALLEQLVGRPELAGLITHQTTHFKLGSAETGAPVWTAGFETADAAGQARTETLELAGILEADPELLEAVLALGAGDEPLVRVQPASTEDGHETTFVTAYVRTAAGLVVATGELSPELTVAIDRSADDDSSLDGRQDAGSIASSETIMSTDPAPETEPPPEIDSRLYILENNDLIPLEANEEMGIKQEAHGEQLHGEMRDRHLEAMEALAGGQTEFTFEMLGVIGHTDTTERYMVMTYRLAGMSQDGRPLVEVSASFEDRPRAEREPEAIEIDDGEAITEIGYPADSNSLDFTPSEAQFEPVAISPESPANFPGVIDDEPAKPASVVEPAAEPLTATSAPIPAGDRPTTPTAEHIPTAPNAEPEDHLPAEAGPVEVYLTPGNVAEPLAFSSESPTGEWPTIQVQFEARTVRATGVGNSGAHPNPLGSESPTLLPLAIRPVASIPEPWSELASNVATAGLAPLASASESIFEPVLPTTAPVAGPTEPGPLPPGPPTPSSPVTPPSPPLAPEPSLPGQVLEPPRPAPEARPNPVPKHVENNSPASAEPAPIIERRARETSVNAGVVEATQTVITAKTHAPGGATVPSEPIRATVATAESVPAQAEATPVARAAVRVAAPPAARTEAITAAPTTERPAVETDEITTPDVVRTQIEGRPALAQTAVPPTTEAGQTEQAVTDWLADFAGLSQSLAPETAAGATTASSSARPATATAASALAPETAVIRAAAPLAAGPNQLEDVDDGIVIPIAAGKAPARRRASLRRPPAHSANVGAAA